MGDASNIVTRDGAEFSKPCLCWHEILPQRLLRERMAAIQISVTVVALRWRTWRLWTSPKFEFVLAWDIVKCLSVAKWNPNDTDIRIRAPHTRATFSVVSTRSVSFTFSCATQEFLFAKSAVHCRVINTIRENFGMRYRLVSLFSPLSRSTLPLFDILFQFP